MADLRTDLPTSSVTAPTGSWLRTALVAALVGGMVGVGLAGVRGPDRSLTAGMMAIGDTPATAPGSDVLDLLTPADAEVVSGAVLDVTGRISRPAGPIGLRVMLGRAVLGRASVEGVPGPFETSIQVWTPAVTVPVELVAEDVAGVVLARRALQLRPTGPVQAWRATWSRDGGSGVVTVEGVASMSVRQVRLHLLGVAGERLATSTATVPVAGVLGTARFAARIRVHSLTDPRPDRVEIDWRDASTGTWGTTWVPIEP